MSGSAETRDGLPILAFADSDGLEAWLAAQPPDSAGFWLKLAKKGSGIASVSKSDAIDAALCHGWIDGQMQPYDAKAWLIRFTPRRPRSKWSLVNKERVEALLAQGRIAPAGLVQVEAARADGRWADAYPPHSRAEPPGELQAALDACPRAAAFFATLKAAQRYAIIYRVLDAKRPETRAKRVARFIAMLEREEAPF